MINRGETKLIHTKKKKLYNALVAFVALANQLCNFNDDSRFHFER